MKLTCKLDDQELGSVIREIYNAYTDIVHNAEETVEILTNEGAQTAQAAYGDWGVTATPDVDGLTGKITVDGDMPLIAEFGAGDATVDPLSLFEHDTETEVFAGSYSLLEGSKQYWDNKYWVFGGKRYQEVEPRMGLYHAKQYIIDNAVNVAKEAFTI